MPMVRAVTDRQTTQKRRVQKGRLHITGSRHSPIHPLADRDIFKYFNTLGVVCRPNRQGSSSNEVLSSKIGPVSAGSLVGGVTAGLLAACDDVKERYQFPTIVILSPSCRNVDCFNEASVAPFSALGIGGPTLHQYCGTMSIAHSCHGGHRRGNADTSKSAVLASRPRCKNSYVTRIELTGEILLSPARLLETSKPMQRLLTTTTDAIASHVGSTRWPSLYQGMNPIVSPTHQLVHDEHQIRTPA